MQDGELIQIGYLVKDLEGAVKFYMETMNVGPWEIYTLLLQCFVNQWCEENPPIMNFALLSLTRSDSG